jgi:hypothetical protein
MFEIISGVVLILALYVVAKLLHNDLGEEFFYNPMSERTTIINGVKIKERFCKPQYK